MGVEGLESFLKLNQDHFAHQRYLNNTQLVIDANNIACALYKVFTLQRDSPHYRNDIYGGDMVRYSQIVEDFFNTLDKCKIEPVLVFEGSEIDKHAPEEIIKSKEEDLERRRQDEFRCAQEFDESLLDQTTDIFLPPNIVHIFRSVAREGDMIQPPFKADAQIVDVANIYECPVLSSNSDFFTHDLDKGFIMLDQFDYKEPHEDSASIWSIKATIFTQDALTRLMPGFKLEVMPLLGIVLGEDCIDKSVLDGMVSTFSGDDGQFRCSGLSHDRIVRWLSLLRDKSHDQAIEYILANVNPEDRTRANELIISLLRNYRIGDRFELDRELASIYANEVVSTQHEAPKDFLVSRMECYNSDPIVLDIIFHNTHYDHIVLDRIADSSLTRISSRPISLALVLLRAKSYENLTESERREQARQDSFTMYSQKDGMYAKIILEPLEALEGYGSLDHLDCYSMIALDSDTKDQLLMGCFRFTAEEQNSITVNVSRVMKLTFASEACLCFLLVKYICRETDTSPGIEFVNALLLTLVYYAAQGNGLKGESFRGREARDRVLRRFQSLSIDRNSRIELTSDIHTSRQIMHSIRQLQIAIHRYELVNGLLNSDISDHWMYFDAVMIYRITRLLLRGQETIRSICGDLPLIIEVCESLEAQMVN